MLIYSVQLPKHPKLVNSFKKKWGLFLTVLEGGKPRSEGPFLMSGFVICNLVEGRRARRQEVKSTALTPLQSFSASGG